MLFSEYLAGGQYPDVISNRQLCAVFTAFKQVLAKVSEEMKPKGAPTPVEDTKGNKSAKTSAKGIHSFKNCLKFSSHTFLTFIENKIG